jgi:hypothetical protein
MIAFGYFYFDLCRMREQVTDSDSTQRNYAPYDKRNDLN